MWSNNYTWRSDVESFAATRFDAPPLPTNFHSLPPRFQRLELEKQEKEIAETIKQWEVKIAPLFQAAEIATRIEKEKLRYVDDNEFHGIVGDVLLKMETEEKKERQFELAYERLVMNVVDHVFDEDQEDVFEEDHGYMDGSVESKEHELESLAFEGSELESRIDCSSDSSDESDEGFTDLDSTLESEDIIATHHSLWTDDVVLGSGNTTRKCILSEFSSSETPEIIRLAFTTAPMEPMKLRHVRNDS